MIERGIERREREGRSEREKGERERRVIQREEERDEREGRSEREK